MIDGAGREDTGAPCNGAARAAVLMIVRDFPPSMEMGAQTCGQIARNLPRSGWTPIVLTVGERYIEYPDATQRDHDFDFPVIRTRVLPHPLRVLQRVRRVARRETPSGPTAPARPAARSGLRDAVLAMLSVPDAATGWIVPAVVAGLRVARRRRVVCLLSSGPMWSSHVAGLLVARRTGLPWMAHYRDPWGQSPIARPTCVLADRMNAWLERAVIERADRVVCVTDRHTEALRQAFPGCSPRKFVTIPNGYDAAEWDKAERELEGEPPPIADGRFVMSYAGSLYLGRSPVPVFEALRRLVLADQIVLDRVRLDLVIVGDRRLPDGREIDEVAQQMGLGGVVRCLGPFPRRETLKHLLRSHLLLHLGHSMTLQVPGKVYEYLRCGRPILALSPPGAQTDLLRTTGGAWIVDPDDAEGTGAAILEAYHHWSRGEPGPVADAQIVRGFERGRLVGLLAAELTAMRASSARQTARG